MCAVYCRFFSCFPIFKANWNKLVSCRRQKAFGMQSAMTLCCSVSDSVSSFFGLRHWPTNLGECSDDAEITAEIGRDRQTRTDGEKKRRSCHLRTRWICVCSCALNWWCQMWVLHIFCLILSSEVDWSRVLKPYRHHHTPPLPLLCPTTPSPLLDYPHSPFPMSALRAIIIMPCINNASQYINNTRL